MHKFNEKCLMFKFWNCLKQHKKIGRVLFEEVPGPRLGRDSQPVGQDTNICIWGIII